MLKKSYLYSLTNLRNTVFYIGVTSNLQKRIYEHKNKVVEGFTNKYNVTKLVYFEEYENIEDAIRREKQLKEWQREWKLNLIKAKNIELQEVSLS